MENHAHPRIMQRRREQKRRAYLAAIGQPALSPDFHTAQAHVRALYYDGGMSTGQIYQQCGVSPAIVTAVLRGYRSAPGAEPTPLTRMRRSTIDRLLSVRYEPPTTSKHGAGARVPPYATRRRLQALIALGYNVKWLAERLDVSSQHLYALLRSEKGQRFVLATTAKAVATAYSRYSSVDPRLEGLTPGRVEQARRVARRHDYAPPICWDDDSISDPSAVPEWTGACGTAEGYLVHRREGIPMCPACAVYRRTYTSGRLVQFSPRKLDRAFRESGMSSQQVGQALGYRDGTAIEMWLQGHRRPQQRTLQRLAAILSVHPEDLHDRVPGRHLAAS